MTEEHETAERYRATPKGGTKWLDRVTHESVLNGWPSRTAWAKEMKVSASTLGGQPASRSLPQVDILLKIAETLRYSVAEQVADLCERRLEQIAPPDPFDVAHLSVLDLHDRLDSALNSVGNRRPNITDITRAVLNSTHSDPFRPDGASPYARWRARLFDVPMGWLFPHVGYHGVEFMRWYGPGRGREEDGYPAAAWWERPPRKYSLERVRGYVSPFWFRKKKPARFIGTDAEWFAFCLERLELIARMQNLYPRADLTPYGGYGESFRALLRHNDGSALRHLFTQQASWSRPDPARGRSCADDGIRLVVLTGPSSVRPVPVGSLVGEALGWETVGYRTMRATLSGVRPITSQNDEDLDGKGDNTWRRARVMAHKRDRPMLVTSNVGYLLHEDAGELTLTKPAKELLEDPTVLIVVLRPAPGSGSAHSWEERARANTATGQPSSRETAEWADQAAEKMADAARAGGKVLTVEISPTYVHWGDAYITPEETREYLWHPTVGDLDVRIAAEVAHLIAHGRPVGDVGPHSLRDNLRAFDEQSVVGAYADDIFAATSQGNRRGAPWDRDREVPGWTARSVWDARFAQPPSPQDKAAVHQYGSAITHVLSGLSPWLRRPV